MSTVMSATARASKYGQMAPYTKAIGGMTRPMVAEDSFTLMETCMRASGRMTRRTDSESTITLMAPDTRDIGVKISSTGMGKRHGRMELAMKVNTRMERRTALENSIGPTDPHIKDNL